jgi:1H-pyrrole-2-carbonyl-[peptidyl-carrier protein] brominase
VRTDVAIVGGGPSGAACAMFLARQGIRTVIIEREAFPRYHIGESMTGECGAVVRELGFEDRMLRCQYPIKHGVKIFGQNMWFVPVMGRDTAGELFDQYTWQIRRSEFDSMMLEEAVARGAMLLAGQVTEPLLREDGAVCGVRVRTAEGRRLHDIGSTLVLDCSGQSTFLAKAKVTGPKYLGAYDRQIAIFSQVVGGLRDEGGSKDQHSDNTLIFYRRKYHWAWWIPLDAEIVSVGIVIPAAYFVGKKETKRDFLARELRELHPELSRRLPEVKLVEDVRAIKNYSYQIKRFCGRGFMCIGDAHRFIDPIFSFGLYVGLKEAQLAAPLIARYLEGAGQDESRPFAAHERSCERAIDILEDLIDAFWERPLAFAVLTHDRYRHDLIDAFAGRIYDCEPSEAIRDFRRLLARHRAYGEADEYSVPIGSRFHPERAALWEESPPSLADLARVLAP